MKVNNYGDIISFITNKPLIAYVEFGSYQGDYVTVVDDGDDVLLYKGYYGSCSGCDWIEGGRDWTTGEIDEAKIREFGEKEAEHSFASIPKETVLRVDADTFTAMLPANVRSSIYDFDGAELYARIVEKLAPPLTSL